MRSFDIALLCLAAATLVTSASIHFADSIEKHQLGTDNRFIPIACSGCGDLNYDTNSVAVEILQVIEDHQICHHAVVNCIINDTEGETRGSQKSVAYQPETLALTLPYTRGITHLKCLNNKWHFENLTNRGTWNPLNTVECEVPEEPITTTPAPEPTTTENIYTTREETITPSVVSEATTPALVDSSTATKPTPILVVEIFNTQVVRISENLWDQIIPVIFRRPFCTPQAEQPTSSTTSQNDTAEGLDSATGNEFGSSSTESNESDRDKSVEVL